MRSQKFAVGLIQGQIYFLKHQRLRTSLCAELSTLLPYLAANIWWLYAYTLCAHTHSHTVTQTHRQKHTQ